MGLAHQHEVGIGRDLVFQHPDFPVACPYAQPGVLPDQDGGTLPAVEAVGSGDIAGIGRRQALAKTFVVDVGGTGIEVLLHEAKQDEGQKQCPQVGAQGVQGAGQTFAPVKDKQVSGIKEAEDEDAQVKAAGTHIQDGMQGEKDGYQAQHPAPAFPEAQEVKRKGDLDEDGGGQHVLVGIH